MVSPTSDNVSSSPYLLGAVILTRQVAKRNFRQYAASESLQPAVLHWRHRCEEIAMEQSTESDKEVVPEADRSKPVFSADQLRVTPPRTPEDIRRDILDSRFAEMTPGLAGD